MPLSNGRRFHRLISLAHALAGAVRDKVLEGCHHTNPPVERRRQSRVARSPATFAGLGGGSSTSGSTSRNANAWRATARWTLREILRQQHQKVLAWKSLKPDTQLACVEASPGSKPSMSARCGQPCWLQFKRSFEALRLNAVTALMQVV